MVAYEDTVEWTAKGGLKWGGPYDSWLYRRPITINNTSGGVLTNHQILVELTTSNHTYSHSEADGADIRFTTDNGIDALDYWIESWAEDGTSKVWVEIDSIPTGEHLCAYIYCGKSGAGDAASGTNTFVLYNITGVQGLWHLDEDSWDGTADEVVDETGVNDGTAHNDANTAVGEFDRCGRFDGDNDYVDCGTNASISFERTDAFSISFYAKSSDTAGTIIGKIQGSGDHKGYSIEYMNTTVRILIVHDVDPSDYINVASTADPVDNTWHHIVVTYDGSSTAAGVNIYIDDVEGSATVIDTLSDSITNAVSLRLGSRDAENNPFAGDVDEIAIFNVELSQAQVTALYSNYLQKMGSFYNIRKWADTAPTNTVGAESVPATGTIALTSEIAWDAKGAFATPTMSLISLIEWDAKGGVAVTAQGAYQDTIEWDAKGEFVPPHSFIFIDLR